MTLEKQNTELLREEIEQVHRQLPTLIDVCLNFVFLSCLDLCLGEKHTRLRLRSSSLFDQRSTENTDSLLDASSFSPSDHTRPILSVSLDLSSTGV